MKKDYENNTEFVELSSSIIDLREQSNHPISFLYSEIYKGAIINANIEYGRVQPGFSLVDNAPFVVAAKNGIRYGIEKEGFRNEISNKLVQYYDNFKPKNAAELLGLPTDSTSRLTKVSPWSSVFPWRARTLDSYRETYEKAAITENQNYGYEQGIQRGWIFCGPASIEKCSIESKRMEYVIKQIFKNGYKRSNDADGDIKVTALVDEDNGWRWIVTSGFHRVCAVVALGYESIPVRVNLVVLRKHVDFWPHVISGLYTREAALTVFDNFFEGIPPLEARLWN